MIEGVSFLDNLSSYPNLKKFPNRFVRVNWRALRFGENSQRFSSPTWEWFSPHLLASQGIQPASRPVNGFPEFASYQGYFLAPGRLDEGPEFGYPLPAYPALGQSRPGW